jgi:hypothetical protein
VLDVSNPELECAAKPRVAKFHKETSLEAQVDVGSWSSGAAHCDWRRDWQEEPETIVELNNFQRAKQFNDVQRASQLNDPNHYSRHHYSRTSNRKNGSGQRGDTWGR